MENDGNKSYLSVKTIKMKKQLLALLSATFLTCQLANAQSCPEVCPAEGLNASFEWIQGVSIGPLTNISGSNNGYADFGDTFSATFTAGTTVFYTLGAGFGDGPFSESWKAWMDFNQDGDFDDVGEEIFTNFGQFQVNGSFVIPATAFNGSTKLRIAMGFGSFPEVCVNVNEGEIEDYCVTIVGGVMPPDECDSSIPVTGLTSTVNATNVTLSWNPVPNSVGCRVSGGPLGSFNQNRNVIGFEVSSFTVPLTAINPAITYNWKVVCGCSLNPPYDLTPDSEVDLFSSSASIAVNGGQTSVSDMTLSPNPTNGNLNLTVTAQGNANEQIIVTDLLGRTVMQENVNVIEGMNNFNLDVSSLSSGTYILILKDGNNHMTSMRFIRE